MTTETKSIEVQIEEFGSLLSLLGTNDVLRFSYVIKDGVLMPCLRDLDGEIIHSDYISLILTYIKPTYLKIREDIKELDEQENKKE